MASSTERMRFERGLDMPVVQPGQSDASLSREICDIVLERPAGRGWWAGFLLSLLGTLVFFGAIGYLLVAGVGIWGANTTVVWAFDITNYVWWIGIGNAGTLISAMLYLMRQEWRTSINRFAEAMTLFAVTIAALFPLMHLGRPYLFYWLIPYPNVMDLWPQFRSPLVWDLFAILSYLIVSILFLYTGLIPDFATLRDRAKGCGAQVIYGLLALGWRGSAQHWQRYERAYLLLAALAVPLVVSVHSVVGLDFSVSVAAGWRETLFPPYFVLGAMFSGFAMVITLTIVLRAACRLHPWVTPHHLDKMAKVLLAGSLFMGYAYVTELFMAWYGGDPFDRGAALQKITGPYAVLYGTMLFCNVAVPQLFWVARLRLNVPVLLIASILVNVGMWLERFIIIVGTLARDFLPSQWRPYAPTVWDWALVGGSLSLFVMLFFLFARWVPMIPIHEMRRLVRRKEGSE